MRIKSLRQPIKNIEEGRRKINVADRKTQKMVIRLEENECFVIR
jgi:hypothetical protein